MKIKLDEHACRFGSSTILKHLESLKYEIGRAHNSSDIEHVHQIRVYARRIRSALPIFSGQYPKKKSSRWLTQLRKLTHALGVARDVDVQLDLLNKNADQVSENKSKSGIRLIILRLSQKRDGLQAGVIRALENFNNANVLTEMQEFILPTGSNGESGPIFSVSLYHIAFNSINEKLIKLTSFDELIIQPEKVDELHKMRIAAKRLRYSMEIFLPIYASRLKPAFSIIKQTQEMLGEIHDSDVWLEYIPEFIEKERNRIISFYGNPSPINLLIPGIELFQQDRMTKRIVLYENFVQKWQNWKEEKIWENLQNNISIPSFPIDAISSNAI
ncbi:MAG: CHAD domain-containing protein [Anaerolineaceae bacterium]|nr:CHAD domain-containing protein [Anaerolineaceae bacterium]